jgi:hypothetical protein
MNTDALKEIDLRRFVTEHYPEIATNGRSSGRCPFHPHDDNPSFSIYQRANGKWAFKCHTCGTGGSIVDLVMHMAGLDFKEARKKACEMAGIPDEDGRRPIREHIYHDENGAIAYKKVKYKPGLFPFYHLAEGQWVKGKGDHPHIPFRLDKIKNEPMVFLVEGERDALTLAAIDFPATSMPCGKGDLDRSGKVLPHLAGKEVRVLYDCGNESDARAIAKKLAAICPKVTLLTLPGRDPAKYHEFDITDLLDELDTEEAKRDAVYGILAAAEPFVPDTKSRPTEPDFDEEYPGPDKADPQPSPAPAPAAAEKTETFDLVEMDGLDMIPIDWLWYPVAPIGMVGTVLGTPGVGKTFMLADLAARVSRGEPLPVYRKPTEQVASGWVIFITSEGVPDKILKPRLFAAGATMQNVTVIKGRVTKAGDFTLLDIRYHLDELRELIKKDPRRCVLVIIDPIASFVSGKADLNNMTQTRQALDTVARFAEAAGLAVIVAIHPNKNETQQLQNRAAGSVQMSAAVKTCWIVVEPKPEDPINLRYLSPYKIATAPCDKNQTLPFYLESADFEHNGRTFEVAKLRWSTEIVECNVEAILSPRANDGINLVAKARALLKEQLKDGAKKAGDILDLAEELGIKPGTTYKAKAQLEIDDSTDGFQGPHMWIPPAVWPEKYRGGR